MRNFIAFNYYHSKIVQYALLQTLYSPLGHTLAYNIYFLLNFLVACDNYLVSLDIVIIRQF